MIRAAIRFTAPALLPVLSACVTVKRAEADPAWVALDQRFEEKDIAITPLSIVENSVCPVDAQCVWAGRLILRVGLISANEQIEHELTLGEPVTFDQAQVSLTNFAPPNRTDSTTDPADYRFYFTVRW